MAEEDITFNLWYIDALSEPNCPSMWEDYYECIKSSCPFSHEVPKYQTVVSFIGSYVEDPVKVYTEIKNFLLAYPPKENLQEVRVNNPEDEKDFERINQLMKEMFEFANAHEAFDSHFFCPFLTETGNCVIKDLCEYAHSVDDQKIKNYERMQEWHPTSMECKCCEGFVYGCKTEECRKQGKCVVCVN